MTSWPRSFNIREGVQRPLLAVLRIEQASKPELLALFSTRLCPGKRRGDQGCRRERFRVCPPSHPFPVLCIMCVRARSLTVVVWSTSRFACLASLEGDGEGSEDEVCLGLVYLSHAALLYPK